MSASEGQKWDWEEPDGAKGLDVITEENETNDEPLVKL